MVTRIISLSLLVFSFLVCFCYQSKSDNGQIGGVKKSSTQALSQQAKERESEEKIRNQYGDSAVVDVVPFAAQQNSENLASLKFVNAPKEAWLVNLGGNVVVHYATIVFQANGNFIYRETYKELDDDKEWEEIAGTIGKWYTENNKISMVFSDGYAITASYRVSDNELIFYTVYDGDGRLGFGEDSKYSKIKLMSTEEEAKSDNFVKKGDWKGVECKEYQEADGYDNIQECIFPNANMRQVYDIVKRFDHNLKTELPATNMKYRPIENGGFPEIEYQYKSKKYLFIELGYAGGETTIEIMENENGAQSKIRYSHD